ncbi:hypothetical protein GCM10009760_53730 [Kitasatospora kazusensis]|uniref:Uncharacterized protein n=1 Tax=Kitasatospora kazusensis TaxID=407974 RepID=A0ABP5LVP8_9ACTN
MSGAMEELCDLIHSLPEGEREQILGELGARASLPQARREVIRTPLPTREVGSNVHSEIEWV